MLAIVLKEGCGAAPAERTLGPFAAIRMTAYSVYVRAPASDAWTALLECRGDGLWMFRDARPGLYRSVHPEEVAAPLPPPVAVTGNRAAARRGGRR